VTGSGAAGDQSVKVEAVQAVVDRITSWQDGATEETVRDELLRGLAEAHVDVPANFVEEVVRRVRGGSEHFDVEPLLDDDE
jgi:hypothetical protein